MQPVVRGNQTLFIASEDGTQTATFEVTEATTVGDFVEAMRRMEAVRLAALHNPAPPPAARVEVLPEERPPPKPIYVHRLAQDSKQPAAGLMRESRPWALPAGNVDIYAAFQEALACANPEAVKWCKERLLECDTIDVARLARLSVVHQDYSPTEACLDYIIKKRQFGLFSQLLRTAVNLQDANLQWYAFILAFVMTHKPMISFFEFRTSYDKFEKWGEWSPVAPGHVKELARKFNLLPKEQEILDLALECPIVIEPSYSILGKRKIEIRFDGTKQITMQTIEFLERLHKALSVEWVLFNHCDNQETMNQIASVIPAPYGVGIDYCGIEAVPETWCQKAHWIYLQVVPNLKSLATDAEVVKFWGCRNLKTLTAPNVATLSLGCADLEHLTVPRDCTFTRCERPIIDQ